MELIWIIIIATSIWVLIDAKKIVENGGVLDTGPWAYFAGCILLWIVVFPVYLYKRDGYIKSSSLAPPIHNSALEQLEKLGALKDKGILTEEEFLKKKKELLS